MAPIIVIGAGAAGLAAARTLADAGREAVVLEARCRIGGRIHTLNDPAFGVPVELGAEFVHGRPDALWRLIHDAGLTAYDVPFDHMQRHSGRLVTIDDYPARLREALRGIARIRHDLSLAEYLRRRQNQNPGQRELVLQFVRGFDAADPEQISAKSVAAEQEGLANMEEETQFRLLDGYGALMRHLTGSPAPLDVRLRTEATLIRWKRRVVEVHCATPRGEPARVRASRVIVALPLGTLQLPASEPGAVRFEPDITVKRRAMSRLGYGSIAKVVLRFREAFWERPAAARAARADESLRNSSFLHDPTLAFPTWWTARPVRVPVLTGWAGGTYADRLIGLDSQELLVEAMRSLGALMGRRPGALRALLEAGHVRHWSSDRFARGAYSYECVGGARARRSLAMPIEGTLFFAGEATDTMGQASTVAGAIASGVRAARQAMGADT